MKIELDGLDIFGAIVPCQSGITWSNQCGGHACTHPEIEGIFVPLLLSWVPVYDPLENFWEPLPSWHIRQFIEKIPVFEELGVKPDEAFVGHCGEAWVPVVIPTDLPDDAWAYGYTLIALAGKRVILTYENSD